MASRFIEHLTEQQLIDWLKHVGRRKKGSDGFMMTDTDHIHQFVRGRPPKCACGLSQAFWLFSISPQYRRIQRDQKNYRKKMARTVPERGFKFYSPEMERKYYAGEPIDLEIPPPSPATDSVSRPTPIKWADLCQHIDSAMRAAYREKKNRWVCIKPDGVMVVASREQDIPGDAVLSIFVEWGFGPAVSFDLTDPQPNLALTTKSAQEIEPAAENDDDKHHGEQEL